MKEENKKFDCPCGHSFVAYKDEYKINEQNVYEAFCPVCGRLVKEEKNFSGSGGGKF